MTQPAVPPAAPTAPSVTPTLTVRDVMMRIISFVHLTVPDFDPAGLEVISDFIDERGSFWAIDKPVPINKGLLILRIFAGEGKEKIIYCIPLAVGARFSRITLNGLEKTTTVMDLESFCSAVADAILEDAGEDDDDDEDDDFATTRANLREWVEDEKAIRVAISNAPQEHRKILNDTATVVHIAVMRAQDEYRREAIALLDAAAVADQLAAEEEAAEAAAEAEEARAETRVMTSVDSVGGWPDTSSPVAAPPPVVESPVSE